MTTARQLSLDLRTHGGKRRGAGRKPKGARARVRHSSRPDFHRATPVHVTLKVGRDVPSLRSSRRFKVIQSCFAASRGLHGTRLVEFSVLGDHLHLVIEADDKRSLSLGVQGLTIRLARALNRLLHRRGKVFVDHYHSRLLTTPTEVANAIHYVRDNAQHHFGAPGVDCCSSAHPSARPILAEPIGWLLRVGWRRAMH